MQFRLAALLFHCQYILLDGVCLSSPNCSFFSAAVLFSRHGLLMFYKLLELYGLAQVLFLRVDKKALACKVLMLLILDTNEITQNSIPGELHALALGLSFACQEPPFQTPEL